jgi:transcriptional regulator with XRE-family HTH domain
MGRRKYRDLATYFNATGETQESFAMRLGVSQACISMIRNGKRVPSLRLAQRIADEAKIPLESLMSDYDRV